MGDIGIAVDCAPKNREKITMRNGGVIIGGRECIATLL
jgi:hypothetical protein